MSSTASGAPFVYINVIFFLPKFCYRSKKVTLMDVSPSNNLQLPM
jgi:hypothetical protein